MNSSMKATLIAQHRADKSGCNHAGCNYPEAECAEHCKPLHHQRVYAYAPASLEPTPERLRRWARKAWHFLGGLSVALFVAGGYIYAAHVDGQAYDKLVSAKNDAYVRGYYAAKADSLAVQKLFCGGGK
jgi:hypothetical protein